MAYASTITSQRLTTLGPMSYQTAPRPQMPVDVKTTSVWGSSLARALLVATLALPSAPSTGGQPSITVTGKIAESSRNRVSVESNLTEDENSQREQKTSISKMLQKKFGFKTAQWALVLKVERKTIYNWEKNPDTKLHAKAVERLEVLKSFVEEIDEGHAPFISKITFSRNGNSEFLKGFLKSDLDLKELASLYDRYYSQIDGMYKRFLHASV